MCCYAIQIHHIMCTANFLCFSKEMFSNSIHKLEHAIHSQYANRIQILAQDGKGNQYATNIGSMILDRFRLSECLYLALPLLDLAE